MIDAYELLREKESAILRLRREIEALRCVIPLLADDLEEAEDAPTTFASQAEAVGTGTAGKKFWRIGLRPR